MDAAAGSVAALDCGTNSTRLLVADEHGRELLRLMRITRLGEGVDATGKLAPEAVERTLGVLTEFRAHLASLGTVRARLVATSAVRDAANGDDFLSAASETVGVPAELLTGEEEGRLAYRGATTDLPPVVGTDVVVDIGGGSTELVVQGPLGFGVHSMDLGCVRLTERYLHHDPPRADELEAATAVIRRALDGALAALRQLGTWGPDGRLLGLAGTVSTLAALDQGLVAYDRDRIHHYVLTRAAVAKWCQLLGQEPSAARGARPGMVEGREDVIVGGALVLREVMQRLDAADCIESEADILDGLVAALLEEGR